VKTQASSGVITIGSTLAATSNTRLKTGALAVNAPPMAPATATGIQKMMKATTATANTLSLKPRVSVQERPNASNELPRSSSTTTWVVNP